MPEPSLYRPSVDSAADFREAIRRAEEAAVVTDESGNVIEGETPVVLAELEGAEPVVASDQPLTEEPVVEADTSEEQQQEAPVVEETVAAPTLEELQTKLAEAEARLAEKDSFIGRQSGEVGELRRIVDELSARVDQAQAQPAPAPQMQITQEMIDENPAGATALALKQGNEQALEIAFNAWREEDPFLAATWLADQKLKQQKAAFDAELAATRAEIKTATAPLVESAEQNAWSAAFTAVEQQRPGFLAEAERLLVEMGQDPSHPLKPALSSEDPAVKAGALRMLYDADRAGKPEVVAAELKTAADEAAAEAAAARAAAAAVNGQATAGQEAAVELTDEQKEIEAYKSRIGTGPSLSRGWTGRS